MLGAELLPKGRGSNPLLKTVKAMQSESITPESKMLNNITDKLPEVARISVTSIPVAFLNSRYHHVANQIEFLCFNAELTIWPETINLPCKSLSFVKINNFKQF